METPFVALAITILQMFFWSKENGEKNGNSNEERTRTRGKQTLE